MLNVLSFGGYLTLYLAFLYGQDPSLIPWVDYFKEQLEKPHFAKATWGKGGDNS